MTEIERIQKRLDRERQLHQAFFDALAVPALVLDSEFRILEANPAACRLTGCSVEDLQGQFCHHLFYHTDPPPIKCPLEKALKENRQCTAEMPVKAFGRLLAVTCLPVSDGDGGAHRFIQFLSDSMEDISLRLASESALRRYHRIVSASQDLMSLVDGADTYLSANDAYADAFGKPVDQIVGTTMPALYGKPFFRDILQPKLELCRSGVAVNFREWFHFPELGRRLMDVKYFPDSENDGDTCVVVNARDITEYRQLEDQLLQSRKMESIGTLAGGIAHEFNNILGIILGNCELAEDGIAPDHFCRTHLDEIHNACLRAKGVVRQLLDFSHKSRTMRNPVPLTPVVTDALKLVRSTVPTHVAIDTRFNIYQDTVAIDTVQIEQLVINLCTNAAHALEKTGGRISVELTAITLNATEALSYRGAGPGDFVCLSVSDDGCGIPDEHLDRIFDPYFTTRDVGQGSGMGLALVHSIVRQHGGAFRVDSQPDKGTRVSVLFPKMAFPNDPTEVASPEPEFGPLRHVLVVDDEPQLVNLLRTVLEHAGYRVSAFTDPNQALDLFISAPTAIDAIITDMTMPGLTGDRFAKCVNEVSPTLPIIICTGHSDILSEANLARIGVRRILLKPVTRADLLNALADLSGTSPPNNA